MISDTLTAMQNEVDSQNTLIQSISQALNGKAVPSGGGNVSVTVDDNGDIKVSGNGGSGSDKEWKLLRKFVVESDVTSISVSEDDDGNPFEVNELKIVGFCPTKYEGTGTLSTYGCFAVIDENAPSVLVVGGGTQHGYITNNNTKCIFGNASYKRFATIDVSVYDNFLDASITDANNQGSVSDTNYIETKAGDFSPWCHWYKNGLTSIKHFMIGQNGVIPAGTVFNVFAK